MIAYFLAAYLIVNGIVFLVYGVDKYKAVHNKWRIPETTLLIAAVFGVIGAFSGMHVFITKHVNQSFILGFPLSFSWRCSLLLVFFGKRRNAPKFLRFIQNRKRKFMHNCELIFLKCSAAM